MSCFWTEIGEFGFRVGVDFVGFRSNGNAECDMVIWGDFDGVGDVVLIFGCMSRVELLYVFQQILTSF